jgi:hypothetical protein
VALNGAAAKGRATMKRKENQPKKSGAAKPKIKVEDLPVEDRKAKGVKGGMKVKMTDVLVSSNK